MTVDSAAVAATEAFLKIDGQPVEPTWSSYWRALDRALDFKMATEAAFAAANLALRDLEAALVSVDNS